MAHTQISLSSNKFAGGFDDLEQTVGGRTMQALPEIASPMFDVVFTCLYEVGARG